MPLAPPATSPCTALHHERKLHHLREVDSTTNHISEHVTNYLVSASALNGSLGRLFAAIADGSIPPQAATQLVNLYSYAGPY